MQRFPVHDMAVTRLSDRLEAEHIGLLIALKAERHQQSAVRPEQVSGLICISISAPMSLSR